MGRRRGRTALVAASLLLSAALLRDGSRRVSAPTESAPTPAVDGRGFVPNLGQWAHPAPYVFESGPLALFVEPRGWALDLLESAVRGGGPASTATIAPVERERSGAALRMEFEGADPVWVPERRLAGHHDYLLGADPRRWRRRVPRFGSLRAQRLYPGIDLRLREAAGHPEYDLLLSPGAELERVAVRVSGAERLTIAADGALRIATAVGTLVQPVPRTWQTDGAGRRTPVRCRYVLRGPSCYGFAADAWDAACRLTIDPGLLWASYVGGVGRGDHVSAVAVDRDGIVTIGGHTATRSYPVTLGAYRTKLGEGLWTGVVTRLDPRRRGGGQLRYSTFLGGDRGSTMVRALHVGSDGRVTAVGTTWARDFPTTVDAADRGYNGGGDVFVSCLDPRAEGVGQLAYSTFFGGRSYDWSSLSVAVAGGAVTVAGATRSSDFPITSHVGERSQAAGFDAFVARLVPGTAGRPALQSSLLIGGAGDQMINAIALGDGGRVSVAGWVSSTDVRPRAGDRRGSGARRGGPAADARVFSDVMVARVDLGRDPRVVDVRVLGGSADDWASAVAVDARGVITVAGSTRSRDLPTTRDAAQRRYAGGAADGFVLQVDPRRRAGDRLSYVSYFGGGGRDTIADLVTDAAGHPIVVGTTWSSDFPVTRGAYDTIGVHGDADAQAFVSQLAPGRARGQILYSTYFGGAGLDSAAAVTVDERGCAVVAGRTDSRDLPATEGAWDTTLGGRTDVFAAKLELLPSGVARYGSSSPGCRGPISLGVSAMPWVGNRNFTLLCQNAPRRSLGLLAVGVAPLERPLAVFGVELWVQLARPPFVLLPVASDALGSMDLRAPIPPRILFAGKSVYAQVLWASPGTAPSCSPLGLAATNGLAVTFRG